MSDQKIERIIVTVDDQHLSEIQSIATDLQSAGMQVDNVMSISGIVTGEVAHSQIQTLKNLPGVVDIELDQEMQAI
jgi:hypothetical protein